MKLASQQKDYIKTVSHKKKGLHQFYISYTIALEKAMDYKIIYDVTTAVKKYSAAVKHNIYMKKCWEESFPRLNIAMVISYYLLHLVQQVYTLQINP